MAYSISQVKHNRHETVARDNSTELIKIAEEAFDESTPFVDLEIAGNLTAAARLRRDDGAGDPSIELRSPRPCRL